MGHPANLDTIARDLNMVQEAHESTGCFHARVVYTMLGLRLRAAAFDAQEPLLGMSTISARMQRSAFTDPRAYLNAQDSASLDKLKSNDPKNRLKGNDESSLGGDAVILSAEPLAKSDDAQGLVDSDSADTESEHDDDSADSNHEVVETDYYVPSLEQSHARTSANALVQAKAEALAQTQALAQARDNVQGLIDNSVTNSHVKASGLELFHALKTMHHNLPLWRWLDANGEPHKLTTVIYNLYRETGHLYHVKQRVAPAALSVAPIGDVMLWRGEPIDLINSSAHLEQKPMTLAQLQAQLEAKEKGEEQELEDVVCTALPVKVSGLGLYCNAEEFKLIAAQLIDQYKRLSALSALNKSEEQESGYGLFDDNLSSDEANEKTALAVLENILTSLEQESNTQEGAAGSKDSSNAEVASAVDAAKSAQIADEALDRFAAFYGLQLSSMNEYLDELLADNEWHEFNWPLDTKYLVVKLNQAQADEQDENSHLSAEDALAAAMLEQMGSVPKVELEESDELDEDEALERKRGYCEWSHEPQKDGCAMLAKYGKDNEHYCFYRYDGQKCLALDINEWRLHDYNLEQERNKVEIWRILGALALTKKLRAPISVIIDGNLVHLNLHHALPRAEQSTLLFYSWPDFEELNICADESFPRHVPKHKHHDKKDSSSHRPHEHYPDGMACSVEAAGGAMAEAAHLEQEKHHHDPHYANLSSPFFNKIWTTKRIMERPVYEIFKAYLTKLGYSFSEYDMED